MLIRVTNVSYGNFLFGRGRFLLSGIIKFLECALRVLFIYLFSHPDIMNKGAYGTAVAFVLSTVFIGIVWRVYSKKEYDKISCSSQIKYILFGIAVMIMFSFFRSRLMQDGNLVNETLFIGLYLFVVYSFYFKMRWLKKNDLQYILPASYVKNLIFSCRNIFK